MLDAETTRRSAGDSCPCCHAAVRLLLWATRHSQRAAGVASASTRLIDKEGALQ